jgi:hypothetical protein
MRIKSVRSSSIAELNERTNTFVAASGYEQRSVAISQSVSTPHRRLALCFKEWPEALARPENDRMFRDRHFVMEEVGGDESDRVQALVRQIREGAPEGGIGFDVSSMTRAWHGAIIRELWAADTDRDIETFFAYVPAKFKRPPLQSTRNEVVAPVDGFVGLSMPDLPIAAVIGLGYEKERALGLQQLLDPERTMLMVPRTGDHDPFYSEVRKNNCGILYKTRSEWTFEYSLKDPAATFSSLSSIVLGLRESYRVVLASLGPKIFGILCLLLATRIAGVSVWRASSGVHGKPRDAVADLNRLVVLKAIWGPDSG